MKVTSEMVRRASDRLARQRVWMSDGDVRALLECTLAGVPDVIPPELPALLDAFREHLGSTHASFERLKDRLDGLVGSAAKGMMPS